MIRKRKIGKLWNRNPQLSTEDFAANLIYLERSWYRIRWFADTRSSPFRQCVFAFSASALWIAYVLKQRNHQLKKWPPPLPIFHRLSSQYTQRQLLVNDHVVFVGKKSVGDGEWGKFQVQQRWEKNTPVWWDAALLISQGTHQRHNLGFV